jgi:bacterioferritin
MPEFVKDVEDIRQRAMRKIEEGPVTGAYGMDPQVTIAVLNEALATEIVCVLRYMHHYFMATGVHGKTAAEEFKEHADAERDHADQVAQRIQQLGGKPDFNPASLLQRSVAQYVEGETLADMIREDLIAERVVIELYSDMVRFFGDKDPTTRVLLEGLLKDEEEHAADLADLLYIVDPATGETRGQDPGTDALDQGRRAQRQSERRDRRASDRAPAPSAEMETASAPQRSEQRGAAVPPAHEPGTVGHAQRQRPQQTEDVEVDQDVDVGAHRGGTRAVRVTKPNRKKRVA